MTCARVTRVGVFACSPKLCTNTRMHLYSKAESIYRQENYRANNRKLTNMENGI